VPLKTSPGEPSRAHKARDRWSHLSRAAKWVVVTVLAAAIGAPVGTLATQVISGGREESDTAGGRTSSAPSASDPKLEELLEHVPSEFRSTCRSVTRPPQDAPASVNCYPSFGAGFVQYRQYLDAATMASDFNAEIESMLAPDPEAERDCSDGKGKEDWEYGLMFCHVDGGGAFVEWIDVRLVIYAWAQRGDGDHEALVESWRQGAFGPNP
jgi:hypothetical protein